MLATVSSPSSSDLFVMLPSQCLWCTYARSYFTISFALMSRTTCLIIRSLSPFRSSLPNPHSPLLAIFPSVPPDWLDQKPFSGSVI